MKVIDEFVPKINKLPEHVKPELNDFIDFLLARYGENIEIKDEFSFNWEGKLSKLNKKYSSVDLQHTAMEWR